jgi:hypothetical protein
LFAKSLWFCLALAAVPALCDDRQVELRAVLYTTYQQPAPPAVVHALEDEVESIMGPLGRHFAWRSIAGVKGNEISAELAVLTFKGRCDLGGISAKQSHPGALGWTHVSDGAILPFSDIDCDRIRTFVQKELLFMEPSDRETAFGRAIARVVSHELYHIFANTAHHGANGVGKSAYTVQELLSDEFHFEEREGHALRTTAAKIPTPQPVGAATNPGHGF